MKRSTYRCDGCGIEKPGATLKTYGTEGVPDYWLTLHMEDYGTDLRAFNWHYCPGCGKRIVAFLESSLGQLDSEDPGFGPISAPET